MSDVLQNPTPKKPPRWVKGFLTALRESGIVRVACDAAKIDRSTVYDHRIADATFAEAWDLALDEAADLLEEEARRRALQGVQRLKFHNGVLIKVPVPSADGTPLLDNDGQPIMVPYVEHEYSDTLAIFLLKGAKPEKYRERQQVEHTGKDGGPIAVRFTKALNAVYADDPATD